MIAVPSRADGDSESDLQKMKYEDDQPPQYPTYGADEYGEDIDGYIVRKDQVSQEDEEHP